MRAARVLEMLQMLQRRGRLTARELARQLDVSERTILRDVDAFSAGFRSSRRAAGTEASR